MTWSAAKSDCASISNGWLVSITSDTMNDIVSSNRPIITDQYWLGGTCNNCATYGGIWSWESGEPWSYTNWDTGQPDFFNHNERCAEMWSPNFYNHYKCSDCWNDEDCSASFKYICQVLPILNTCPAGIYTLYIITTIHSIQYTHI